MIRVTVEVEHSGGSIEVVEADPLRPQNADMAKRVVERTTARALTRAKRAIDPAEERRDG